MRKQHVCATTAHRQARVEALCPILCKYILLSLFINTRLVVQANGRGEPTASSLSTDGFPLMAGLNLQPSDGNATVISILRQLADGPENVPEM